MPSQAVLRDRCSAGSAAERLGESTRDADTPAGVVFGVRIDTGEEISRAPAGREVVDATDADRRSRDDPPREAGLDSPDDSTTQGPDTDARPLPRGRRRRGGGAALDKAKT